MLRRWLIRLSWSFLIVALALTYDSWRGQSGQGPYRPPWRITLQYAVAAVLFVLFIAGTKLRHRGEQEYRQGEQRDDEHRDK